MSAKKAHPSACESHGDNYKFSVDETSGEAEPGVVPGDATAAPLSLDEQLTFNDWRELSRLLSDDDLAFRLVETVDVAERYL